MDRDDDDARLQQPVDEQAVWPLDGDAGDLELDQAAHQRGQALVSGA